MNKLWKYGSWLLGIALLCMFIFPHAFLPAGLTGAFALGIFTQACSKNVSGAQRIFIADKASITAITVAAHEVSAVTGTTPFVRVDVIQDSVTWEEKGELIGLNNWKITNTVGLDIMPPATATNAFLQSLIDDSACGFFAIVIDNNAKCWLVGHNETDLMLRPLRLKAQDHKTGKGLGDAAGNTIPVTLWNECSGLALPFNAAMTATILAGTDTCIKWS